jgi:hypothetical protein
MQDGATSYRTESIFRFLNEHFWRESLFFGLSEALWKRHDWPAYSPDLNPYDFFLWGRLKDRFYQSNPKTLE